MCRYAPALPLPAPIRLREMKKTALAGSHFSGSVMPVFHFFTNPVPGVHDGHQRRCPFLLGFQVRVFSKSAYGLLSGIA